MKLEKHLLAIEECKMSQAEEANLFENTTMKPNGLDVI